jgi:hypothetical protein
MPADDSTFDPFDSGKFFGKPVNPRPPAPASNAPVSEDDDYELEGPDEHILEAERRRTEQEIETAKASIDIDEIYRETEAAPDWSDMWKGLKFQYQRKQLIILTAVVAVIVLIMTQVGATLTIFAIGFICLVGVHGYLAWRENQRQEQLEVRRQEMYERARLAREGKPVAEFPPNDLK